MDNTKKERFVDGVEKIHFLGGVVRIDFATFQPNPENPDQPGMETKERIIMTPEGFLRTFNSIQQLAEQLLKQGVLKKNENPQQPVSQSKTKIS